MDRALGCLYLLNTMIWLVLSNKKYGEEVVSDYNTAFNKLLLDWVDQF